MLTPLESVEELRAALAARDQFIGSIAHELRNQMGTLVLLAQALGAIDNAAVKARSAMLSRSLDALVGTADKIGEVAALRDGKLVIDRTDVDLAHVVSAVCTQLHAEAQAAGCELRRSGDTVVIAPLDRGRVEQIVKHLVRNAIRYSGGGPIDIATHQLDGDVELVVHDAGPGIPLDARAHLFDGFDRAKVRRHGGLGVGLCVVSTLCQAMGGTVRLCESERGARFCIRLPRV